MNNALGKALTARAALARIRKALAAQGIDASNKKLDELPQLIENLLPPDMAAAAAELLADPERVEQMLSLFADNASKGYIMEQLLRPSSFVREGHLYGNYE